MSNSTKTNSARGLRFKQIIKSTICLTIVLLFTSAIHVFSQGTHPLNDDEFVGPFPSWINVKTQFGAVGDGVADETQALQAAFNAVGSLNSASSVVFLPAGTYRITGTLTMNRKQNISIIGADPATTIVKWDGAAKGIMMEINGTAYSRFNRITWDGRGIASIAVDQSYSATGGFFDAGNEYADNVFTDVEYGLRGGFKNHGFAEIAIMRCKFIRNSLAGVSIGNFNALDVWIWHCLFQDCTVAVTNYYGAGNFDVFNCTFKNSTYCDLVVYNTGQFSFRDNTSINSNSFLAAFFTRNPSLMTIQGNKILDPVSSRAIYIGNHGPVTFVDNIIRSRAGSASPAIFIDAYPTENEFFAMGNTFTIENALQTSARKIVMDNPVVSRESLSHLTEPVLPGTQPSLNRQVFEVPKGSNGTAIQNIINQAAAVAGTRPVVHFPHGSYFITSTLTVPAGADMQITGDSYGDYNPTWLKWIGGTAGPIIDVAGPTKVTFRDISFHGNYITGNIRLNNVDQTGSRVFMHEFQAHTNERNMLVNGLDNTLVLAYNSRFSKSSGKSINVIGGPFAASGSPKQGRTILFAGLEFDNLISHEVTNGGNLLVRDVWYESNMNGQYLNLPGSATFTTDGCRAASPANTATPFMNINNFSGKATFTGLNMSDRIAVNGNGAQSKILGLGVLSLGSSFIQNTTSPAADIRTINCRSISAADPGTGSKGMAYVGQPDSLFFATMLESTRNVHVQILTPLPAGVTDARFYRVWSLGATQALELNASSSGTPLPTPNSNLSNLVLSTGTLTPSFLSSVTSYSASVANNVASITVTPTAADPTSTIKVNGITVVSGNPSGTIPLSLGSNTITIVVTAADGTTIKVYTVVVTQAPAVSNCPTPDNISPVIITKNISVTLSTSGIATIVPADVIQSVTDNCAVNTASYSVTPASFNVTNIGSPGPVNTVIVTAMDVNGNVGQATAQVTVRDTIAPVITTKNATVYINANGLATLAPSDVIQAVTDASGVNNASLTVTPSTFTCASIGATGSGGSTVNHQAYIANTNTGNQKFAGETGLEFRVNNSTGIVINQLGAFDHLGNGITGSQNGGIRVAIFNKATQAIVPGLDVTISGMGDQYSANFRMKNITPVTLPAGTYTLVAKGFNDNEQIGNFLNNGGVSYPAGSNGGGVITFLTSIRYGDNQFTGFAYPANSGDLGSTNTFLSATFNYVTTTAGSPGSTVSVSATDIFGNVSTATAQVTVLDNLGPVITPKNITVNLNASGQATIVPADVMQSVTDNCALNTTSYTVSPNTFSCTLATGGGGTNTGGTPYQAYIAANSQGNQNYAGEVGVEFRVNAPGGIVIDQLGAFDHQGNGITGVQAGGVRVAVFNKLTQLLVPGLDATIVGTGDAYTSFFRMKNITPVSLPAGNYVLVAKGYNNLELLGNVLVNGSAYPTGETGNGAISFLTSARYGPNVAAGFNYPSNGGDFGSLTTFLGGTFKFTTGTSTPPPPPPTATSTLRQAYIATSATGNQLFAGEVGVEFRVNASSGIVVSKLGAFDHQANGISGSQSGGIRVAIFRKATQTIVPGLEAIIIGTSDTSSLNHKLKNMTPVTLTPGDYVLVAKGYNSGEMLGNALVNGASYAPGDDGSGAITFLTTARYGSNTVSGFGYPANGGDFGSVVTFLAGTFMYSSAVATPSQEQPIAPVNNTVTITAKDIYGNTTISSAVVTVQEANSVCAGSAAQPETTQHPSTTAMEEVGMVLKSKDLQVYPNPTSGSFTVQLSGPYATKAVVQIINENGMIISQRSINVAGKNTGAAVSFNLANQPSGMYIIKVMSAGGIRTSKIMLQR